MKLDDVLEELEFWKGSPYQRIVVRVGGMEYPVGAVWAESDQLDDSNSPDSKETYNHRIVLEI